MLQCFEVKGIEASGSDSARAVPAWTPPQQSGARKCRLFRRLSQAQKTLQKQPFTPLSSGISAPGTAAPGDLLLQKRWDLTPGKVFILKTSGCFPVSIGGSSLKKDTCHIFAKKKNGTLQKEIVAEQLWMTALVWAQCILAGGSIPLAAAAGWDAELPFPARSSVYECHFHSRYWRPSAQFSCQCKSCFSASGMKLGKIRAWFTISFRPSFTHCLCVARRAGLSRCEQPGALAWVSLGSRRGRPEKQVLIDGC